MTRSTRSRAALLAVFIVGIGVPSAGAAFRDVDVTFSNGPVTLAGTLTLPAGDGPFPALVLLTGSGAQNRDEELFGFKPFKIIAEHLADQGVAVLRYDDRGVGGSTGSVLASTTEDFAGDALAAVTLLRGRGDIHSRKIGLLGHSEGALAGVIAASRSDTIAFVILLAGSTLRGDEVLRGQAADLARAAGADAVLVDKIVAAHRRATDALRADAPETEVLAAFKALGRLQIDAAPEAQRKVITDPDVFVDTVLAQQAQFLRGAWMRYFVTFDPAVPLARVTCPILAVFGGKDMQVPPASNRPPLEAAVAKSGNRDVTIKVYPDANHLFIPATTGNPSEYGTLEKRFVPGLLEDLTAWIQQRTRP
jgi:hypothetical protein